MQTDVFSLFPENSPMHDSANITAGEDHWHVEHSGPLTVEMQFMIASNYDARNLDSHVGLHN